MKKLLLLLLLCPFFSFAQETWETFKFDSVDHPFTPRPYDREPFFTRPYIWTLSQTQLTRISLLKDTVKFSNFPTVSNYSPYNRSLIQFKDGRAAFFRSYDTRSNTINYIKNSIGYSDGVTLKFKNELSDGLTETNEYFDEINITNKYIWAVQGARIIRYDIETNILKAYLSGPGQQFPNKFDRLNLQSDSVNYVSFLHNYSFYVFSDTSQNWINLTKNDMVIQAYSASGNNKYFAGQKNLYFFENRIMKSFSIPNKEALGFPYEAYFIESKKTLIAYYTNGFVVKDADTILTTIYSDYIQSDKGIYYHSHSYNRLKTDMSQYVNISVVDSNRTNLFHFSFKDSKIKYEGTNKYNYYDNSTTYKSPENDFYFTYVPNGNTNKILVRIKNGIDSIFINLPYNRYTMEVFEDDTYLWVWNETGNDNPLAIMRLRKGNFIQGQVYYDFNKNGIKDIEDVGVSKFPVVINPKGITIYPASNGRFSFSGDLGEQYKLSMPSDTLFNYTSQILPATILHTGLNTYGISLKEVVPQATTNFNLPWPRCNTKPKAFINIVNDGYTSIDYMKLTLTQQGKSVLFLDETSTSGNDTLTFELSNLPVGATKKIEYYIEWPDATATGNKVQVKLISSINKSGSNPKILQDSISTIVRCSYDPNDKSVSPAGVGS